MCTRKVCLLFVQWIYRFKVGEVNVHFCTLCVPKKCAFFQRQWIREAETKRSQCTPQNVHFCTLCVPKKCAFFQRQWNRGDETKRSQCTPQNVHFAHYVYPKSVPSFNDNGIVEMKLREVNVHFCTLCIPKKCAFFQRQWNRGDETKRSECTLLHIMYTQKVCLLSTTMDL